MKNNIWNVNMTAMEKFQPELKKIIDENVGCEAVDSDEFQISVEMSYTEEPITVVNTAAGKYCLAGKYHPEGMAERISVKYEGLEYGSVIFSIGLSDGRVLNRIAKTAPEKILLLIYEPSMQLFLHTLKHYDCSGLIERKDVCWLIGDTEEVRLGNILSMLINVDNMLKVKPIIQGNYDKIFNEQVKAAIQILKRYMRKLRVDWNTWIRFSENTINNTIKNGKYVYEHYAVDTLFNTLPEDVPAIVVAAGPSLDKNIHMLKEAKGKACILACDTALKPLLNRGIVPDFFFIVDPSKPFELFDHPAVWDIPMVTGMNIPDDIMSNHKGKKIFYIDNFFMVEIFEEVFGEHVNDPEHTMSPVPTGGSVATTAFSAARLMGAKNIILIGQDLALSGEMEHASGTFKRDRKSTERKLIEIVKDIYGNDVKTTPDFKYYLDWYGYEIEKYPGLNVIDATEGGAFINGTTVSTLEEAIHKYCRETFSVEQYLEELPTHFNEEEKKLALEFMRNIPRRFEKIRTQIRDGKKWYRQLEKYSQKEVFSKKEIEKVLKKIKKINLFMEEESLTDLVMDGVKRDEYLIRTTVYHFQEDQQKNLLDSAKMGLHLMEKMEETLEKMWPDIEELGNFDGTYEL